MTHFKVRELEAAGVVFARCRRPTTPPMSSLKTYPTSTSSDTSDPSWDGLRELRGEPSLDAVLCVVVCDVSRLLCGSVCHRHTEGGVDGGRHAGREGRPLPNEEV